MSYHYKDIYRIIIPGIILFFVLTYWYPGILQSITKKISGDKSSTVNVAVLYVFLIPIIGFLLGFINNFISALIEKGYYRVFSRPSLVLLKDKCKLIRLSASYSTVREELSQAGTDLDKLYSDKRSIRNDEAYKCFSIANQKIDNRSELIETNYNYMILSRNSIIPMTVLGICLFCQIQGKFPLCCDIIILIALLILFLGLPYLMWQWYSLMHTKYIFVSFVNK